MSKPKIHVAPDGSLATRFDDFSVNWSEDTPEFIEVEETSADEPEYWSRGYVSVETLRELLKMIDHRMDD